MKIIYCHCSLYNPGGMERVLLNKVRWICKNRPDWEVIIVTTDQQNRPPFYAFPEKIRIIDLGINYSLDNDNPIYKRIPSYLRKRRLHRARLTELLMREHPDITVSLYPSESSFIPRIKDGSKKVLELHFNRYFRLQYGRKGIIGLIDRWRSSQDIKIARGFDRFVVLTEEDCRYWGKLNNIIAIPNAAENMGAVRSELSQKKIIAVGRLDFQKGFDRLIKIWKIVQSRGDFSDWHLDIFGQGEWHDMLQSMITDLNLRATVCIHPPTDKIANEYVKSSIIAMTSNYEGFGMVLVEAMSCGVPAVAFDCKCGPSDIVDNGVNGILVNNGNLRIFADALLQLMSNDALRRKMGAAATRVVERYSEEKVMGQWMSLFENITRNE